MAISPQPAFYSTVRLAALSLARLGEPYSSAPIVVSVGDHADADEVRAANRWSDDFPVVWRIVAPEICDREGFGWAPQSDRFVGEARADVVLHCDSDVCVTARFDELLDALQGERPKVAGLPAHFSPFADRRPASNDAAWRRILDACGLPDHPLDYCYSQVSREQGGSCPAYFNYGFVAFNRSAFQAIQPLAHTCTRFLLSLPIDNPFFAAQIGLAIAIAKTGAEILPLGPRYNCPNSDEMLTPGFRPQDIAVIHFLRDAEFDRRKFLVDPLAFRHFKETRFASPVNEFFRRHVLSLPDIFYGDESRPAGAA